MIVVIASMTYMENLHWFRKPDRIHVTELIQHHLHDYEWPVDLPHEYELQHFLLNDYERPVDLLHGYGQPVLLPHGYELQQTRLHVSGLSSSPQDYYMRLRRPVKLLILVFRYFSSF